MMIFLLDSALDWKPLFGNSTYKFKLSAKTLRKAYRYCERRRAHLVWLETVEEYEAVRDYIQQNERKENCILIQKVHSCVLYLTKFYKQY